MALHPGEVSTDMSNVNVDWTVEGVITPHESVQSMLNVIEERGNGGVKQVNNTANLGKATFWTWEGNEYPW